MSVLSSRPQIALTACVHAFVMTATSDLPVLDDQAVPGAALLGVDAVEVLGAAFAPLDATVVSTKATGATYHRGRSLTVRHDATVRWPDGKKTTEKLVLSSGRRAPDGSLVVSDGTHDIVVWRFPADPWLPGLAAALDPDRIRPLLTRLGFADVPLRCRVRAYRPGRRAVVEVTGDGVRVFLKVVRPSEAEALQRRHEALSGYAPIPTSFGWSEELGIVVLQALPGRTLRDALRVSPDVPPATSLLELLDSLPEPTFDTPDSAARRTWRLEEFASHIGSIAPQLEPRLTRLAAGLAPFEAEAAAEPVVPVHGDFYEAQLLVKGSQIVGLLDVDTFGWGRRIDDLATYVGHLVVLTETMSSQAQRNRVQKHARHALDVFDRVVDPAVLRAAIAAVVLGLATGSFRVLEPRWRDHTRRRLAIAEAWLASAEKARKATSSAT